ncbi:hypothetical protein [Pseudomonas sp. PAMC 25886]|jgi:hypothetical protein|uniref:hypothetical protein n=1 Tax=Pseudomonas sp. PAMC 25886 TaxID=1125977 RepID=UPI00028895C3|nr:hypothetical protein [Pseudomonas sp. PAMC 25886]
MAWQYFYPNRVAKHLPSGVTYSVDVTGSTNQPPFSPSEAGAEVDATELDALRKLYEQEKNRWELQGLIQQLFLNDYAKAVVVLNETPGRKVSVRTLQAWQMAPGHKSSRTCPAWAIAALRNYQENNSGEIQAFREMIKHRQEKGGPRTRVDTLYNGGAVEAAERRLVRDEAYREKLKSASMGGLPVILAEDLLKMHERYERLLDSHLALIGALRTSNSFEELKEKFSAEEDDLNRADNLIRTTYDALRNGEAEFSADDGTLPDNASFGNCILPGS